MADKPPARKIKDGKVGDQYYISTGYGGNWQNATGLPMQTPRGPAQDIPKGDGPVNLNVVTRPDFRKVDKKAPVHGQK